MGIDSAADGNLRGRSNETRPLTECPAGTRVKFVRVLNQGPEFLRFLSSWGLAVGIVGSVVSNISEAGTVRVDLDGRTIDLGYSAADKLLVEPVRSSTQPQRRRRRIAEPLLCTDWKPPATLDKSSS